MPARRKYEISTYPQFYAMLHMYEAIVITNILMQVL